MELTFVYSGFLFQKQKDLCSYAEQILQAHYLSFKGEMINIEKAYEKFMNILSQIESSCNISADDQMDLYDAMLEEVEDQKHNLYAELHQW